MVGTAAPPPPRTPGMRSMFFFQQQQQGLFLSRRFLDENLHIYFLCACFHCPGSLHESYFWLEAQPPPEASHGFLFFCRLQAGNWKMGHRKPGLPHLSHFVTAALVSFGLCVRSILTLHATAKLFSKRTLTCLRLRTRACRTFWLLSSNESPESNRISSENSRLLQ